MIVGTLDYKRSAGFNVFERPQQFAMTVKNFRPVVCGFPLRNEQNTDSS